MIETKVDGTMEYTPQVLISKKSKIGFYFPWNDKWESISKSPTGSMEHSDSMRCIFKTPGEAQAYINDFAKQLSKEVDKQTMSVNYVDSTPSL